jgi:hypothetical protein
LTTEEEQHSAVMEQVERLEGYLVKLGTVHHRAFSAREKNIRDGLEGWRNFREGASSARKHLGFSHAD